MFIFSAYIVLEQLIGQFSGRIQPKQDYIKNRELIFCVPQAMTDEVECRTRNW